MFYSIRLLFGFGIHVAWTRCFLLGGTIDDVESESRAKTGLLDEAGCESLNLAPARPSLGTPQPLTPNLYCKQTNMKIRFSKILPHTDLCSYFPGIVYMVSY